MHTGEAHTGRVPDEVGTSALFITVSWLWAGWALEESFFQGDLVKMPCKLPSALPAHVEHRSRCRYVTRCTDHIRHK